MDHTATHYYLMQSCAQKGMQLLTQLQRRPDRLKSLFKSHNLLLGLSEHLSALQSTYGPAAAALLEEQRIHWQKEVTEPIQDKRFNRPEWSQNPFFHAISQHYLLASKHVNSWLESTDFGSKPQARRARFLAHQVLDALSPDNFFFTNPLALEDAIHSQGISLLRGLESFLTDLLGLFEGTPIKLTDTTAFSVGKDLAITPGKVIFKNELMELIQYTPSTQKVRTIPLLIIPPWINKYYILDLNPRQSLIRALVSQGISVFVISWVNPDARYAHKGLTHYLNEGPIAAIPIIQAQLGIKHVNLLGFCLGGTLLSLLLAYYKAQSENPVRSATFLASLIDFSEPGDIGVYLDEQQIELLEAHMQIKGYLEGQFMACAFYSLRARDLIWSYFIKTYLQGKPAPPFDVLYWNADCTNMPARMHSEYLRGMYLCNDLIKPGKLRINNTPIDIRCINTPVFFVATQQDHIALWESVYAGFQLMRGKKCFVLGGSGHIAGIINPPGTEKYGYYHHNRYSKDPKRWLARATLQPGSWWPAWFLWLHKKSGRHIKAPQIEKLPIQSIMDAPGEYVHQR